MGTLQRGSLCIDVSAFVAGDGRGFMFDYDEGTFQWMVDGQGRVSGDGIFASYDSPGQYQATKSPVTWGLRLSSEKTGLSGQLMGRDTYIGDFQVTLDHGPTRSSSCAPAQGGDAQGDTGRWIPTDSRSAPPGRRAHVAVWTGSEMLVVGGLGRVSSGAGLVGARYSPTENVWKPIAA